MNASCSTDHCGPYKFLDYFTEADRPSYAGRDADVREVIARSTKGPTFVLYGRSGLGKTSLLLAGIFPELRRRGCRPVYVRTLESPLEDLCTAVAAACSLGTPACKEDLYPLLKEAARDGTVVLVLDQFEEFFIRFADRPQLRHDFIRFLGSLACDPSIDTRVLFSLREDYLAALDDFRSAFPELFANEYRLKPLSPFGARQAIVQPLIAAGAEYDQQLVVRLVDQLASFGFDPPVLQIACCEVYRQAAARMEDRTRLTEVDLERIGGLDGIFRRYLDRVTEQIRPEDQLLARTMLDALITQDRTKRAITVDSFFGSDFVAGEEEVRRVLDLLVSKRLVRAEQRGQQVWYELIHERLVPLILDWIERDRDFFSFRVARELVANSARGEVWREQPETLLNRGQVEGVVSPYNHRLRLDTVQLEFMLWSAIYRQTPDVSYWSQRFGQEQARQVVLRLMESENETMRLGAVTAAESILDDGGSLAEASLRLALSDPSLEVRRAAGRSLARLAGPRQLEFLKSALRARHTRREALETLADMHGQKHSLEAIGAGLLRRTRRIANRRVFKKHRDTIRQRSAIGALTGLLAGLTWTCTIGVLLVALFLWAIGELIDHWLLGVFIAVGGGLLLTLPLGTLLGWRAGASAAKRSALGVEGQWFRAVATTWTALITLLAAAVLASVPMGMFVTEELLGTRNPTVWDYAPWIARSALGLASCAIVLLYATAAFAHLLGVRSSGSLDSQIVAAQSTSFARFTGWIERRPRWLKPPHMLSVLTSGSRIARFLGHAFNNRVFSQRPVWSRRSLRWAWILLGSLGLPCLVPLVAATSLLMWAHVGSSIFTVVITVLVSGIICSFVTFVVTIAISEGSERLPLGSRYSSRGLRNWTRGVLVCGCLATMAVWLGYFYGVDTLPFLANTYSLNTESKISLSGSLGPGWPDSDYFRVRSALSSGSRLGPKDIGLFMLRPKLPNRARLRIGDESTEGEVLVAVRGPVDLYLVLSNSYENPPVGEWSYTVGLVAIQLHESDTATPVTRDNWSYIRATLTQDNKTWQGRIAGTLPAGTWVDGEGVAMYLSDQVPTGPDMPFRVASVEFLEDKTESKQNRPADRSDERMQNVYFKENGVAFMTEPRSLDGARWAVPIGSNGGWSLNLVLNESRYSYSERRERDAHRPPEKIEIIVGVKLLNREAISERSFARAWNLLERDDIAGAVRELVDLHPHSAVYRKFLGMLLLRKRGNMPEAVEVLQRAVRLNPDDYAARDALGQALVLTGRLDEAIKEFRLVVEKNPGSGEYHANLGAALHSAGKLEDAIGEFQEAVRLDPENVAHRNGLAWVFCLSGRFEEALPEARKAASSEPESIEIQDTLAHAAFGSRQWREAAEAWEKVLKLNAEYYKPPQQECVDDMSNYEKAKRNGEP